MRLRQFNFALAAAVSVTGHLLLWPASKHIVVSGASESASRPRVAEVTLLLAPDPAVEPKKPDKTQPKPPVPVPEDEMGEKKGKGTGAQSAKGETPLKARDADQDQAFLSRDPVGHGKVGDQPTVYSGPRGEDGHGGQRGGMQVAQNTQTPPALTPEPTRQASQTPSELEQPAPAPKTPKTSELEKPAPETPKTSELEKPAPETPKTPTLEQPAPAPKETPTPKPELEKPAPSPKETPAPKPEESDRPPVKSPVKTPEPPEPKTPRQTEVTPPPSKTASNGAATPDLSKPPADEVKATAPLAQAAPVVDAPVKVAPEEGPSVLPQPAVGTAAPMKNAPPQHPAIALAPPIELPKAPVSAPPPPAVQPAPLTPKTPDVAPAKPPAPSAPQVHPETPTPPPARPQTPTAALVQTGDARAPGQDRPSADPAQESDSESDPFIKNATEAVFHDGRLEVRHGRKVKTVRPHFLPGAQAAFYANPDPTIVLKISIDETGNVKDVGIIKSSGSVSIDQPVRRAAFDWWFEPRHDKQGRPMPDVVPFTIIFR